MDLAGPLEALGCLLRSSNIDSLIVNSNNLTTNAIDDIFSDLAAGVVSNGLLRIDVGRSIPGSDADKATLVGRGWTITEL